MSLVAYGSSDESEEEGEETEQVGLGLGLNPSKSTAASPTKILSNSSIDLDVEEVREHIAEESRPKPVHSLFQHLPKPKQTLCESTDQDELESHTDVPVLAFLPVPQSNSNLRPLRTGNADLNKKVGSGPVRITLPSLSEFNDEEEDEPIKKRLKPSKTGSGLFAILPAPKNIKSRETQQPLIPHVLTKKVPQRPQPPSTHFNKNKQIGVCLEADNDSEDDDGKDFFSLTTVNKPSKEVIGLDLGLSTDMSPDNRTKQSLTVGHDSNLISRPSDISSKAQLEFQSGVFPSLASATVPPQPPGFRPTNEGSYNYQESNDFYNYVEHTSQDPAVSFPPENLQLDAEAMQRLCGKRSKKNQEPVEIIDVNGTEIMPDPREWLVKQLSEEQPKMRSHSHKRNDGPTTQQRRKHQITYLAFQAKENELELKNQWSQNRMSRKQTQSKYGF